MVLLKKLQNLHTFRRFSSQNGNVQNLEKSLMLEFNDHEKIYSGRSTGNLIKHLALLKLCSLKIFSRNAFRIFETSRTLLGATFFGFIFKPLVYDLYIAGNQRDEILYTMENMETRGLRPLLSPMLEDALVEGGKSSEEILRSNLEIIESCIEMADTGSRLNPKTLAIKLSAFIPTQLMNTISLSIRNVKIRHNHVNNLANFFLNEKLVGLDIRNHDVDLLRVAAQDLIRICKKCKDKNVILFIDAEYSHLQPAVRLISLSLMKLFNTNEDIVIASTYQCYLKRSWDELSNDLDLSLSSDFILGCKIVRGAYLESEKTLCIQLNEPFPIHDDLEATHDNYNRVIKMLLNKISQNQKVFTLFATHNLDSVIMASEEMKRLGIERSGWVHFGQINGMSDQVSSGLSLLGFSVLKLVPCGTIEQVLPWLSRRMQENGSVFERTMWERSLLSKEIHRRMKAVF